MEFFYPSGQKLNDAVRFNYQDLNFPQNYIYVAKRLNNAKRRHLFVNALQAKHIPVPGAHSLALFDKLADITRKKFSGERLLVIGFAETATAIGARLSIKAAPDGYFVTTTREFCEQGSYIEFSESHSHAQRQLLDARDLDAAIDNTDRLVFAEDELTTGNTILGLIDKIRARYPRKNLKFGVACLISSMDEERKKAFLSNGLECVNLRDITIQNCANKLNNTDYYERGDVDRDNFGRSADIAKVTYANAPYVDQRRVCDVKKYSQAVNLYTDEFLKTAIIEDTDKDILILGTEEFMYPAICAAALLAQRHTDKNVYTHATTRSPIEVFKGEDYPLYNRGEIISLYEQGRANYIYNLRQYDSVYVLSDAIRAGNNRLEKFSSALFRTQAKRIGFFLWNPEC